MVRWTVAFQNYALAASAVGVWQYPSAMAHMRECLHIAVTASSEGKRFPLAIMYDEICRKHWHEIATRGWRLRMCV